MAGISRQHYDIFCICIYFHRLVDSCSRHGNDMMFRLIGIP